MIKKLLSIIVVAIAMAVPSSAAVARALVNVLKQERVAVIATDLSPLAVASVSARTVKGATVVAIQTTSVGADITEAGVFVQTFASEGGCKRSMKALRPVNADAPNREWLIGLAPRDAGDVTVIAIASSAEVVSGAKPEARIMAARDEVAGKDLPDSPGGCAYECRMANSDCAFYCMMYHPLLTGCMCCGPLPAENCEYIICYCVEVQGECNEWCPPEG